ncbi:hypothetical protein QAD02_016796 [Eretmocerus hayati]|uniref:Uncharacterized protein n=1 Tax=Eretmocerus hayati TaxID=131215 RepID=A0ACC2PBK6_9HYME|nr:hypothetical protein QAD02_016796 [Eretmocerus hayati]
MQDSGVTRSVERSSTFWRVIENELEFVEPFIKNIIAAKGLDDHVILRSKNESIFDELETFVKSGEYTRRIPPLLDDTISHEFYGHCGKDPSKFFFMIGHKSKVRAMIEVCKNQALWENASPPTRPPNNPLFERMDEMMEDSDDLPDEIENASADSTFMRMLTTSLKQNANKVESQRTYPDAMIKFCMYTYFNGGTMAYQVLSLGLPIPPLETIHQRIKSTKPRVDGEFEIRGLKEFLKARKLPPNVWISESVTKCVQRFQYNARDNEVAGFVRHLDENGMPRAHTFRMRSVDDLKRYLKDEKPASILYCYMAQPIAVDAPPYCLALFGSDESFSSEDCLKRWDTIARLLEQERITVLGFSSEDDPRLLKAMCMKSRLGEESLTNATNISGFCAEYLPNQICIQDPVTSVVSKLFNRFLLSTTTLTIGEHGANLGNLADLVDDFPKDKHQLTHVMLSPKKDFNLETVVKVCHSRVIKLLKNIPESEGTVEYLKLMNMILHSYLSTKMSPLMRIYCMWYPVFFLRLWHTSLGEPTDNSVIEKFIPFDTYVSIEINAHSLVNLILKNMNKPNPDQSLLLWQCSTKICKELFKMLRTPDCYYRHAVNCTPLEALRKVQRIELIDDIITYDYSRDGEKLNFPKTKPLKVPYEKITVNSLCVNLEKDPIMNQELTISAVQSVIDRAKQDAFQQILKLGVNNVKIEDCHGICARVRSPDAFVATEENNKKADDEKIVYSRRPVDNIIEVVEQCLDPEERTVLEDVNGWNILQDHSMKNPTPREADPLVEYVDGDGKKKIVLKSSVIHWYSED